MVQLKQLIEAENRLGTASSMADVEEDLLAEDNGVSPFFGRLILGK
jgi:hypothetical protein